MATGNIEHPVNQPAGSDNQRELNDKPRIDTTLPHVDRVDLMRGTTPANGAADAGFLKGFELTGNRQDGLIRTAFAGDMAGMHGVMSDATGGQRDIVLAAHRRGGTREPHSELSVHEVSEKPKVGDRVTGPAAGRTDTPARTFEIKGLQNRSGQVGHPDAMVRLPENFDPSKPINLVVYNHGWYATAKGSMQSAELHSQMQKAQPNTVLIVPEWQMEPGAPGNSLKHLSGKGNFDGMIRQAMQATPGLAGKDLKDVKDVMLIAHSAGGAPTNSMLFDNQIGKKVNSLVLIDSIGQVGAGKWVKENLHDFVDGKKQLIDVANTYRRDSEKLVGNISKSLQDAKLPDKQLAVDLKNGHVLDPKTLAKHSLIFNRSTETYDGKTPHFAMPNLYVGRALEAQKMRAEGKTGTPAATPEQAPAGRPEQLPAARPADTAPRPEQRLAPEVPAARKDIPANRKDDALPVGVPPISFEPVGRPAVPPQSKRESTAPVRPAESIVPPVVPQAKHQSRPAESVPPVRPAESVPAAKPADKLPPAQVAPESAPRPSLKDIWQGKTETPRQSGDATPAPVKSPIKPEINRTDVPPNALDKFKLNDFKIVGSPNEIITTQRPLAPERPAAERPAAEKTAAEKAAAEKVAAERPAAPEDKSLLARKTLEATDATVKQKMEALSSLYKEGTKDAHGRVHVTLNDNGKPREFQIAREAIKPDTHLIQMYGADQSGRLHPVLRAVERGDSIEKQKAGHNRQASYSGDWWSQHNRESNVSRFGAEGQRAAVPQPARLEREQPRPVAPQTPKVEREQPRPVAAPRPAAQEAPRPAAQEAPRPAAQEAPRPAAQQLHRPAAQEMQRPAIKVAEQPRPEVKTDVPPERVPQQDTPGARVVRDAAELRKFYNHQDDGKSCSAFSMGMLHADHVTGRPMQYGKETEQFKRLAGVTSHGYRGTLETMANQLRSLDLNAKAYDYGFGKVGPQALKDLNKELDQGRSAVAKVINPHTGNPHYIYVAGRDNNGRYIIGDPDRSNNRNFGHDKPVEPAHLLKMMGPRNGFVVAWSESTAQRRIAAGR